MWSCRGCGRAKAKLRAKSISRIGKPRAKRPRLVVGYLPAARVAALPTDDLLKRIELLIDSKLGTCTLDVEKRTAGRQKLDVRDT